MAYVNSSTQQLHAALDLALAEERGLLVVSMYEMAESDLEALVEAAQLIDSEGCEILDSQDATQRTKGGDEAHRPCVTGESAATRGADAVRASDPPTSDRARTERLASDPGVRHDEHDGGDDAGNVPYAGAWYCDLNTDSGHSSSSGLGSYP